MASVDQPPLPITASVQATAIECLRNFSETSSRVTGPLAPFCHQSNRESISLEERSQQVENPAPHREFILKPTPLLRLLSDHFCQRVGGAEFANDAGSWKHELRHSALA